MISPEFFVRVCVLCHMAESGGIFMSSKIFQNVINQMKESIDRTIGVIDDKGIYIASNDLSLIGNKNNLLNPLQITDSETLYRNEGKTFKALPFEGHSYEYVAYVDGDDAISGTLCSMAAVAFNEARLNFDEKHNRASFIKNIISDNILPGDVYVRAKELHFTTDTPRCVVLIRQLDRQDIACVELISRLFPDRQNDFVISVNDRDIVLVKLLSSSESVDEAIQLSGTIEEKIKEELGITTNIGVSTVAEHLRELADKYKEAQVAIEVGNIFEADKTIIKYDSLGLGRIIYQLPTRLCEMFLNEVFKKNPIDTLDEDTLDTIDRFFENNLNVSETSRKLYVHRNTLVYRLEKIKKLTGLDLREFDHAIVFKVALMVKMYLDSLSR